MAIVDRQAVEAAIRLYQDPYLHTDLLSLGAVRHLAIADGVVRLDIELGYPCLGIAGAMRQLLTVAIEDVPGVVSVQVDVRSVIQAHQAQRGLPGMAGIRNIIAVASGKGGVGKSTTAVNLAIALAQEGARVGILDADIYGPSVGMMLGIPEGTRPNTLENKFFLPIEAHGVQAMSMAFLVNDNTPMVWRGPMVSGALQQLLTQTQWNDLDYLVIDMPPGTGDIQLTLSQKVPVTGAVIVTTPQDIALLDCKKGVEMFRKVEIPVIGIVENMSVHICSHCGHHEALFGEGGGARIAEEYDSELLAQLPLHLTIRAHTDGGTPTVAAAPDTEVGLMYRDLARRVGALLSRRERDLKSAIPSISISND